MVINWERVFAIVSRLLVLTLCIPAHECAHGWAAYRLGDNTAKEQGRLTLNPLRHFDPLGTLCLVLLGFGWAKPVPVNPRRMRCGIKTGMALTALAGPAANLIMAFLLLCLYRLTGLILAPLGVAQSLPSIIALNILSSMVMINVSLGVFNLLPINPLDGSRIFGLILPDRIFFFLMRHENIIMFLLMLLLYFTDILDKPLYFLSDWIIKFLLFSTSFIDVIARLFGLG